MNNDVSKSFESYFGQLKDPRIDRKKLYPLVEVMFVVLCGSICGAESWRDYVLFGKSKIDYLRQYYAFRNGIPSKNTFARVFAALDTEMFKLQFVEWVKSLQTILNEVIAIDGKTLCNSIDEANGISAIHMVSAFATGARLVLAQQKVDEKSNEVNKGFGASVILCWRGSEPPPTRIFTLRKPRPKGRGLEPKGSNLFLSAYHTRTPALLTIIATRSLNARSFSNSLINR